MQRAWQLAAASFAVVFALWAHQSWQLSLTDSLGPGPGFFPFWLSVIGAALSLALIGRIRRDAAGSEADEFFHSNPGWPRGARLRQVVVILAALAAVAALLETLGFRLVVAGFCRVLLPTLGARNWLVIALFAIAASIGVNAVFSDLLKVPLPSGVFDL